MPRGNARHRGDVVSLHHYNTKSLEEMVRRRVFGRRPNTALRDRPLDLNATEVSSRPGLTNLEVGHDTYNFKLKFNFHWHNILAGLSTKYLLVASFSFEVLSDSGA